ncbi:endoplasmic reticulum-resident kdel protein [Aspergillus taichungensis]|uniref:Endoplasmic reticulum-resident kdel protein n=1 Tax=Aspergillus taichungensis TaxID=482145 RepID=A0A2J5HGX8_9EURO|nr:endoplasmic reticulum-resident kdel protein [Aspergillus taichungensis]
MMGSRRRLVLCVWLTAGALLGIGTWVLWFGMNSDGDNVPAIVNQLIPAGHCACKSATTFHCAECLHCPSEVAVADSETRPYDVARDAQNRTMSAAQCQRFFPGLFEDVRRAGEYWTSRGGVTREAIDQIELVDGMARAAIVDGQLYVVATRAKGEDHRRKIVAVLSALHRALVSSPEGQPTGATEFVFSIEDRLDDVAGPDHPLWILARRPDEKAVWLMPDFGYWAWDNGNVDSPIGPYGRVVESIRRKEIGMPWSNKEAKLVWRGKLSFAPKMRRALLEVARGQAWSDVKELDWRTKDHFMSMEDHCRYRFIAHVEGRSYSASLKYRQACESVVIAHQLQFIQHHHYLLVSSGPDQNFVEVQRDFADLPAKMQALLDDSELAERIARNSASTFRDRYLTPAAETCYWRALVQGWMDASPGLGGDIVSQGIKQNGLRYESFLLMDSHEMLHFTHDWQ